MTDCYYGNPLIRRESVLTVSLYSAAHKEIRDTRGECGWGGGEPTCSTRLIHWKLSSSVESGRCSATTTILSSLSTVTENTAILQGRSREASVRELPSASPHLQSTIKPARVPDWQIRDRYWSVSLIWSCKAPSYVEWEDLFNRMSTAVNQLHTLTWLLLSQRRI